MYKITSYEALYQSKENAKVLIFQVTGYDQ